VFSRKSTLSTEIEESFEVDNSEGATDFIIKRSISIDLALHLPVMQSRLVAFDSKSPGTLTELQKPAPSAYRYQMKSTGRSNSNEISTYSQSIASIGLPLKSAFRDSGDSSQLPASKRLRICEKSLMDPNQKVVSIEADAVWIQEP
jgi:hypothetical protein